MAAILDEFGTPIPKSKPVHSIGHRINARYDAAQTTTASNEHWSSADGLSSRLSNSPGVRKVLRERARYEWANNCYCKGMLRTDADYVIGTGPRLQLMTPDDDYNQAVESRWQEWVCATRFNAKLWTGRLSWVRDGEVFAEYFTNYTLETPVKLDVMLIECDQITDSPTGADWLDIRRDDGIIRDDFGNVIAYRKWPHHPGDRLWIQGEPDTIPARDMFHLFREERAGQTRGVPEITPALMLYPAMRRWTYAALGSAEKAARISGVLKSTYAPDDPEAIAAMEEIYLEADSFLTMPEGWDITQLKAEQPAANYEMFKRAVVGEVARCLNMPYNIAAADSSKYNFASGKLDHVGWYKSTEIDQCTIGERACTPTFKRWFYEASRVPGYLPEPPIVDEFDRHRAPDHVWYWDGQDFIDPREANAQDTALKNGSNTLTRLWARRGKDVARELTAQAKALGRTVEELQDAIWNQLYGGANEQQGSKTQSEEAEGDRGEFGD